MKCSVIIPAYNAEKYIAKAIESCLNQTYAPHEIIVIDDASTDGTAAIAESFPLPVRVLRLAENMGVSVARNRGVQASTGDWLAFLDADDWFLPEKLECQRLCLLENPHSILNYTGNRVIGVNGLEPCNRFFMPTELWPRLRYRNGLIISSVLLRRDAFDSVGGFDPTFRAIEDWDLWLRLAFRYSVKSFTAVMEPLVVYRRVAGSLSSNAMRLFNDRASIIRGSCLMGTTGLSRFLWFRRITAFNYYDTSIALREEGSPLDLPFIFKSIALWPFPWSDMSNRYKIAAVMVKQLLFKIFTELF